MQKQAGFTLIELLIGIAIAAILLSLGVPAFTDSIARSRIDSAGGQLVATLNLARSEAIKRARQVSVCPRSEDEDGNLECGEAADWADGWMVMADGEAEPVRVIDRLRDMEVDASGAVAIVFSATGARVGAEPILCISGQAKTVRSVSVNAVGHVSAESLESCPP